MIKIKEFIMMKEKRIWIIGGSSGIGLELVKIFLRNNCSVVVSSRNTTQSRELVDLCLTNPKKLYLLNLDVSKDDFKSEIDEAWNVFDGLDIWFYNAGAYNMMNIEQWNKTNFIQMNETNYLGVIKVMTDILPYFKKQGYGRWIWNLSLSTYFGLPNAGGYSAPKAALLNLAQSIQPELSVNNIFIQVINHGFVKTRLTAKNNFKMPQLMSANYAATRIFKELDKSERFEIHFPFGLSFFLKLLSFLPYKISLALNKKMLP